MWIELPSRIARGDIDLCEVPDASHLYEIWRLDEVGSQDRAVGNEAGAVSVFQAPGQLNALGDADRGSRAGIRGRIDAKVIYSVNCRCRRSDKGMDARG